MEDRVEAVRTSERETYSCVSETTFSTNPVPCNNATGCDTEDEENQFSMELEVT